MKRQHHGVPHRARHLALGGGQLLLFVVAVPAGGDVLRSAADQPNVVVVLRGTGLGKDFPVAPRAFQILGGRGIVAVNDGLQKAVGDIGGIGVDDPFGNVAGGARPVLQNDFAVSDDLGVGIRLVVISAVAEHLIGGGDLAPVDAVCHTAQRHRRVVAVLAGQRGHVQGLCQEVKRGVDRHQGIQNLRRHRVHRGLNGFFDGGHAAVLVRTTVVLRPLGAVFQRDVFVPNGRGIVDDIIVDRRRVNGDRLDGGAGLSGGIRGAVQNTVSLLFTASAHHGDRLAGVIHDKD